MLAFRICGNIPRYYIRIPKLDSAVVQCTYGHAGLCPSIVYRVGSSWVHVGGG